MDQVRVQYMNTSETAIDGLNAVLGSQATPILRAGHWLFRFLYLVWLGMGIYFLVFPPKDRGPNTAPPGPFLIGFGAVSLGLDILPRWAREWTIRRKLAKLAEKDRWISWTITPDDVEWRDHLTTARLKWARFTEVVEQKNGFLFLLDPKQGSFLPALAFTWPDEARFVSDWARRRVAKYRTKANIAVEGKPQVPFSNDEL